jgi:hypothetical protein
MSTFSNAAGYAGGGPAHAVGAFRDPAVYDARSLQAGSMLPSDIDVTPAVHPRRHLRGHLRRVSLLRQLHLIPATGGLR